MRGPMERAFGADFSRVRIHTNAAASLISRQISARAFTSGHDIFFGDNEYRPNNRSGQELLAHELTHVVQQNNQVRTKPAGEKVTISRKPAGGMAPAEAGIIQRAWTGRRQLAGMGWLGRPLVFREGGNLLNWGGYHEHIFFEDGGNPANIGHLGPQGLGQDAGHGQDEYTRVRRNLNDKRMRVAVTAVGDPGRYSLWNNNCQDYVQDVLAVYDTSAARRRR